MSNVISPNILSLAAGDWPTHFTNLHQLPTSEPHGIGEIDPRYLQSPADA
jgi:hypothetical protein